MDCPNRDVEWCAFGPGDSCKACPARNWQVNLVLFWHWLLRHVWPIGLILAVSVAFMPDKALAAHNPAHNCAEAQAQAIIGGLLGGKFALRADGRVTWTDGVLVCVFNKGVAETIFKSRNAEKYIAKDLAKHGGKVIPQSKAAEIVGKPKGTPSNGVGSTLIVPRWALPDCWQGQRNICLSPYPSVKQ